jgi:hypothetical protein
MGEVVSIDRAKSPGKSYFGEIIESISIPEAAVVVGAILAVGLAQFVFVVYGTLAPLVASAGCMLIGLVWGVWLRGRRRTEDWTPPFIDVESATPSSTREDIPLEDAA